MQTLRFALQDENSWACGTEASGEIGTSPVMVFQITASTGHSRSCPPCRYRSVSRNARTIG